MGDINIDNVRPLNPQPMYPWQSNTVQNVPSSEPNPKTFKENLEQAQQNQSPSSGEVMIQKSEFAQPSSNDAKTVPSDLPQTAVPDDVEQDDTTIWPKPYTPTMYKTKRLSDYRKMSASSPQTAARGMHKNEAGNPFFTPQHPTLGQQIQMYKQDQLLSNPGGDYYFMRDGKMVYDPNYDFSKFGPRVGKDLSDAVANFKNAGKDLVNGAEFCYVDQTGQVQTAKKTGLLETLGNFVKNFIDALTFNHGGPDKKPDSALQKIGHFGKKFFVDGVVNNILIGVPSSMINVGEDVMMGMLNAMEIVPDATIGNFEAGRKLTTSVFDNGQVALDYMTDVLPAGEAWLRVHAPGSRDSGLKLPVLYNLKTPVQGLSDMRWAHVRNTPFRKAIETVGSILSDVFISISPYVSMEPEQK